MAVDVDVVIVGDVSDAHVEAVVDELEQRGCRSLRFNLEDIRSDVVVASPTDGLSVQRNGETYYLGSATTAWWYRAGTLPADDLEPDEARLANDESFAFLVGTLTAAGVRWVDEPSSVERAELKPLQLALASALGQRIPETWVTDDSSLAGELVSKRPLVAKPLSSGTGIAPFVDEIKDGDVDAVAQLPVLLQERVAATADLRVVNIGTDVWAWTRPRGPNINDWRAVDPKGTGFSQVDGSTIATMSRGITAGLGLTMSVQDWLQTQDGPVFLEANPQGAWLFLDGARDSVAPALAEHLLHNEHGREGHWPRAIRRFFWDFLPKNIAPENDGVVAPPVPELRWVDGIRPSPVALEAARRAHVEAKAGARVAENKATRFVQTALALIAISTGLGAYQLAFALDRGWPFFLTLAPVGIALVFLALAAFEALEVDRVGIYSHPTLHDLALDPSRDPTMVLMVEEEHGRYLASWTSRNKHSDVMQARAWFSRGLAALIIAAVLAGVLRAVVPIDESSMAPATPTPAPRSSTGP